MEDVWLDPPIWPAVTIQHVPSRILQTLMDKSLIIIDEPHKDTS